MNFTMHSLLNLIKEKVSKKYISCHEQNIIAWQILEFATQKNKAQLISNFNIPQDQIKQIELIIREHIELDKPLQYTFGTVPFLDLEVKVEAPILIPRPETEEYCANLISQISKLNSDKSRNKNLKILDLCTGTGCIALSFGYYLPQAKIWAIDINPQAIALAKYNANLNKLNNINFLVSDIYQELPKDIKFDLIISNPPYITKEEWETLDPVVKNWEDKAALYAPNNGLKIIKDIIKQAPTYLTKNQEFIANNIPQLVIEFGHKQGNKIKSIFNESKFDNIQIKKDIAGKDRVVYASLA